MPYQSDHKAPEVYVPCGYHCGYCWRAGNVKGCRACLLPYGSLLPVLPGSVRPLRHSPLFSPTAMPVYFSVVLSGISAVPSTRSCAISAWRTCSHTSACVHVRKRLYTVCQEPWRCDRAPGDPRVQPIQNRVQHPAVALCMPSALRLPLWGKRSFILFH